NGKYIPGTHPENNGNTFYATCTRSNGKSGWSHRGRWIVGKQAQKGWGTKNAGTRLNNGQYIANFEFKFPDADSSVRGWAVSNTRTNRVKADEIAKGASGCPVIYQTQYRPGVCWSLKASYD